jgi:hypothetical protein
MYGCVDVVHVSGGSAHRARTSRGGRPPRRTCRRRGVKNLIEDRTHHVGWWFDRTEQVDRAREGVELAGAGARLGVPGKKTIELGAFTRVESVVESAVQQGLAVIDVAHD